MKLIIAYLLLSMNESLHEEWNGQLSGSERDVIENEQWLWNVTANLPHETIEQK